ncbi:MAG: PD-(D/E)XK nuclease family protein [Puniceicoccales bacterium]|jgi:hypothetical protein|nr:PD-(D/E)XK nuclease family protein [Puniceicoccales bacterium]
MPGFITNNFSYIQDPLLATVAQIDPLAPLPAVVLCPTLIDIKILKYFFAKHGLVIANTHFYTVHRFIVALAAQFIPDHHVLCREDIHFLIQNDHLPLDAHLVSRIFLESAKLEGDPKFRQNINTLECRMAEYRWLSPTQALEKMIIGAQPIFSTCILWGYSSGDGISTDFLKLLRKISSNTLFFAFDDGDSALAIFEALEENFGCTENIYGDRPSPRISFSAVEDLTDGVRYCGSLVASFEIGATTAIICSLDSHAQLIGNELSAYNIHYHNGFPMAVADARDNFVFAWYQWQYYGDLKHFLCFLDLIAMETPWRLSKDYYAYLSRLFHRYPTDSVRRLAPQIADPQIIGILSIYPLLPECASMHELMQKTLPIIPEICGQMRHFPFDFEVQKNAFLDYILAIYRNAKPLFREPCYGPIFIMDPLSAARFHFDCVVILDDDATRDYKMLDYTGEHLTSLLSASTIHFIGKKNNISIDFSQQYEAIHHCALTPSVIQDLTRSIVVEENAEGENYENLEQIHRQRCDGETHFGPFEYTVEVTESLALPITAVERAFSDPEEIWYRYVLKNCRPPLHFDRAKFSGIFTHDFLHWPGEIRPSLEEYKQHIAQKQKQWQQILAPLEPHLDLQEAMNCQKAYVLAEKVIRWDCFSFIASEWDIEGKIILDERIAVPLYGRADCILSKFPLRKRFHRENRQNEILLIDLKTGSTTQNDLLKLTKPFTALPSTLVGLQLVLYGLILENMGYSDIQLLIVNGDPYDDGEPIALHQVTQGRNFAFIQNFLRKLLVEGRFGFTERNAFLRTHFQPPIAILPPESHVVHQKRRKVFCPKESVARDKNMATGVSSPKAYPHSS